VRSSDFPRSAVGWWLFGVVLFGFACYGSFDEGQVVGAVFSAFVLVVLLLLGGMAAVYWISERNRR
jgi:hypothetical protein